MSSRNPLKSNCFRLPFLSLCDISSSTPIPECESGTRCVFVRVPNHSGMFFNVSCSNQVLTFKEINWQSLRIEADAIESDDQDLGSTPLRLITNQGRIRIALKRRVRLHFCHACAFSVRRLRKKKRDLVKIVHCLQNKSSSIPRRCV